MTPTSIVRLGLKFGWATGAASGALVGSLVSGSRPDLVTFVSDGFLLMLILLPLFFYLNIMVNPDTVADRPLVSQNSYPVAGIAWAVGLAVGLVSFMIPVLMVPIVLNKANVTLSNSGDWFRAVETQLLGWRGLVVVVVSLIGFMVMARSIRDTKPAKPAK